MDATFVVFIFLLFLSIHSASNNHRKRSLFKYMTQIILLKALFCLTEIKIFDFFRFMSKIHQSFYR